MKTLLLIVILLCGACSPYIHPSPYVLEGETIRKNPDVDKNSQYYWEQGYLTGWEF